jgi:hypothetical protein
MASDPDNGGSKRGFDSMTSLGLAIGAGAGVALGLAFGNLALGIAIGAALGVTIGGILDWRNRDTTAQHKTDNPRWLWWLAVLGVLLFMAVSATTMLLIVQSR